MTDHILKCNASSTDYAEAYIDADGDVRLSVTYADRSGHIYARPAEFAAFARKLLAGTGESLTDNGPVKVGDHVEITMYREHDRAHVGKRGVVNEIDTDSIPYLVHVEGYGGVWARDVRKVTSAVTPSNPFAAHVDEAKRLLAGNSPTAADIVALARELADRA